MMNPTRVVEGQELPPVLRWLFLVGALLAFIAGVQLFLLSNQTDMYFAWTIQPPLTAAFLGAFFWASASLFVLSAREQGWAATRIAFITIFPFTLLMLIATLVHIDRFHLDSPNLLTRFVTWVWFAVYLVLPPVSLVLFLRQLRAALEAGPASLFPPRVRVILGVEGAVAIVVGAGLFLASPIVAPMWPWQLTPLTAQAIGAYLFTFGGAALVAVARPDFIRLEIAGIAYALVSALQLVALVRFAGDVDWNRPGAWVYLIFLVIALLVGLNAWFAARRSPPQARRNRQTA